MDVILKVIGTAGLLGTGLIMAGARRALRGTTLRTAWGWAAAALVLWTAVWTADVLVAAIPPVLTDQLWYAVSLVMLCSLVAVLGARSPGARVWSWFVLLPLLLVLGWPAMTAWYAGVPTNRLHLELPALLGYGLVLLMSAGNYLGTRFSLPAILLAAALALLVVPLATTGLGFLSESEPTRLWATIALAASAVLALKQAASVARPASDSEQDATLRPFNGLWIEFRDCFGIVWAKRILERVNDRAQAEGWPARLHMEGLVWSRDHVDEQTRRWTAERIDHTLRWLLRRFVDPEWIDARLK